MNYTTETKEVRLKIARENLVIVGNQVHDPFTVEMEVKLFNAALAFVEAVRAVRYEDNKKLGITVGP